MTTRIFLVLLGVLLLLASCALAVQAAPGEPAQPQDAARAAGSGEVAELKLSGAAEVLVGLKTSTSLQSMVDMSSATGMVEAVVDEITSAAGTMGYALDLKPEVSLEQALAVLRSLPNVAYAEPNYVRKATDTPTDPDFSKQWGFNNTGQYIDGTYNDPGNGTLDADIDAVEAWDIEKGNTNPVTVAIIDTGIDNKHPDLDGKVWNNSDEVPANRVDDDGNGYIDDAKGYNWTGISQPYYVNEPWYFGRSSNVLKFSQSIVGTGQYLTSIGIVLEKVGTPTQNIVVSVRSSRDGADLASYTIYPSQVSGGYESTVFKNLSSAVKLSDGVTYYIVFRTTLMDTSNYYLLYDLYDYGDFYAPGSEWQYDGSSWQNYTSDDFCFGTNANGMPRDDNGHGTHCAGIVGAERNGAGVVGTSSGATIMPLKAGNCGGGLTDEDIIAAIYYAADNGADIISMSFGGTDYSSATQAAVDYAYGKGVTLFAATGNSSDSTMQYPAGYNNIVGVGATDLNDDIALFSTYNSSVDISAPGVDIYSTLPTYQVMFNTYYGDPTDYGYCSGTSMATPMSAGLAALILARHPGYTPAQVQQIMQDNTDDLGAVGWDVYFGYGRINANNALGEVTPSPVITSLSHAAAIVGTVITIDGSGFGGTQGASFVSFGNVNAGEYVSWSDTQIKVKVPAAAAGAVGLTVTTDAGTSLPAPFKVKPRINQATPTSGKAGTVVTITGSGFGATRGTSSVKFGSVAANYVSWSSTLIKVKVPAGAAGAVNLTVTTSGGKSNAVPFSVKPAITKIAPISGAPGTTVTITGTGFGASRGTSYVKFGTVKATTYVSWSNTAIKCKVPAMSAGTRTVKVTTAGGTSSGVNFTVE